MSDRITFYADDDVNGPAIRRAREAGVQIVTAVEAGNYGADDRVHFAYAIEHGYVLVTGNIADFEALFFDFARTGADHPGIVFINPAIRNSAFLIKEELQIIFELADSAYMKNRIWRMKPNKRE